MKMKLLCFGTLLLGMALQARADAPPDTRPFTEVPIGAHIMLRAAVFNGWDVMHLQRPMLPGSTQRDVAGLNDVNGLVEGGKNGPGTYAIDVTYQPSTEGRRFKGIFSVVGKTTDRLVVKLDQDYTDSFDKDPSGLKPGEEFGLGCVFHPVNNGPTKLCTVDNFDEIIYAAYGKTDI